jgi:methylthioribose-1-phosphate isomerase
VQEEVFSLSDETDPAEFKKVVLSAAMRLQAEDEEMCEKLGSLGAELIEDNSTVLTNCNAGALATCGIGTALACVYTAASQDKRIHVVCCETRPLLQGARLSTWELKKAGILTTLICDNMAGTLMRTGRISAIFVGADRIAANGDVANKIGTYPLAVLANAHSVPFYVVAPSSSFDLNISSGEEIPIEERSASEIIFVRGKVRIAPDGISVYNPAFDVTPSNLITAIIWEGGILKPPYRPEEIKKAISKGSNCADKENPLHHRYKQF